MNASPSGGSGSHIDAGPHLDALPPASPPVVNKPPERRGNRLYWTPACPIVAQNFNNAADVNGATSDPSSTGWYLDASKVPNAAYFAIKSHRIKAQTLGGVGVWYSQPFNIAGWTNVQIDAKISSEGTFTSSEYMTVGYILDGKETDFETVHGSFGNDSTPTVTSGYLAGNTVQIVVKIYNVTAGNSYYYVEQYDVFKELGPCTVSTSIPVTASASNSGVLTCSHPSTTLTASTTASGTTTYSWTGPSGFTATGASVTATAAGTYTVTGTNSAGTGTASVTVTSNTAAPGGLSATASGSLSCSTTSVTLTGSSTTSGATFAWSGPGGFTAAGATATATVAGTYMVTATNPTTGCTSTASVAVTGNTTPPAGVAIATANNVTQLTCATNFITVLGSSTTSGATFSWSGPNNFNVASAAANVFNPGTYTLTVTNPADGCTSTANVVITQNATPPAGVAIAPNLVALTCSNPSATLTGSSSTPGVSYSWSGPNSFTATGTTTTVISAGEYILTVSDPANGCTSTTAATISTNFTPPANVTAINNGPQTCSNVAVLLTGSSTTSGATFAWTGPNGFTATGATTNLTSLGQDGTYTLTATNPANGCTAITTTVVAEDDAAPTGVSLTSSTGSPILNCTNASLTLTASSTTPGVTYAWRIGPNGSTVLGTAASLAISQPNTYDVLVTNPANGCTFLGGITVSQNITPPASLLLTSNPSDAILTCATTTVAMNANASNSNVGYSWTGPGGFTFNGQTTNVAVPGTYSVTATDSTNGCSTTASATVTQNITPPSAVTIGSATGTTIINCTNPTLTLTAGSTPNTATYSWSGPNSYSANTAAATVNTPGTYTVTATETDNGCSKTANVVIAIDTAAPTAVSTSSVPANAVLTCTAPNVILTGTSGTPGVTYLWTGPNSFSLANAVATATTPGSYILTVTNPGNGCSTAVTATAVTQNVVIPVGVTANVANKITCTTTTTTLTGNSTTSGATFAWTGPDGFTSAVRVATASLGGVYTLTATNPTNGCTATKTVTVVADTAAPTGVTATNSGELNCTVTTVTLTGNSTTSGATYIWTGPNGYFDPEQISSMASDSGTYVLTVANPENGCSTQASTYVAMDLSACSAIKAQATAGRGSGFDDSTAAAGFSYKVYPNPVSSTMATIEFKAPVATQVIVEIYNNAGAPERVLYANGVEANQVYRVTLNPGGLGTGIHYCMIRVNGKVYTTKLLVMSN